MAQRAGGAKRHNAFDRLLIVSEKYNIQEQRFLLMNRQRRGGFHQKK